MLPLLIWAATWVVQSFLAPSVLAMFLPSGAVALALRVFGFFNRRRTRVFYHVKHGAKIVAFFHPYADDGGGGERVLWQAIHALSEHSKAHRKKLHIVVYIGGPKPQHDELLQRVKTVFGIDLTGDDVVPITFAHLRSRQLLEPSWYPVFTMLGQSLGAAAVAVEALLRATPDVWFDTTGWAYTYVPARIAGCSIGAYVHYPTVSTDMLKQVRHSGRAGAVSSRLGIGGAPTSTSGSTPAAGDMVSSKGALSLAKVAYYHVYGITYCIAGCLTQVAMVNSKWTLEHVKKMWSWRRGGPIAVVYPPCNTKELEKLDDSERDSNMILSIGQFRPEKDHALQLHALAALRKLSDKQSDYSRVRLVMAGGCRNKQDAALVENLKKECSKLGLNDAVSFEVNCDHEKLVSLLRKASIGIHTMWNEHFGIGIVEMMAAGLVVVAHASGGPAIDIIGSSKPGSTPPGYLAADAEDYADKLARIISGSENVQAVRQEARKSAKRFSDEAFDTSFVKAFAKLIK